MKYYLNKEQLKNEINKCLNCKTKPCNLACPVNCGPHEFINYAKMGDYDSAVQIIEKNNPMGHTCGLICPDHFCMKACTRSKIDCSVNIPLVQATLLKLYRDYKQKDFVKINKKIAIIGAGPAGLAAAWCLLKKGYGVDVFEKSNKIGGALNLIPNSRLPHKAIEDDWKEIETNGQAHLFLKSNISDPLSLLKEYDGVIIAVGKQNVIQLNVEGEEFIVDYTDYLKKSNKYANCNSVIIIGGGKVAVDCALKAYQSGIRNIKILIRRNLSNIKMSHKELEMLQEMGIQIVPNQRVRFVKMKNSKLEVETNLTYVDDGQSKDIEGSTQTFTNIDMVIKAIGSVSSSQIQHQKIIYAGDSTNQGSTVVEAVASGIKSATILDNRLSNKKEKTK